MRAAAIAPAHIAQGSSVTWRSQPASLFRTPAPPPPREAPASRHGRSGRRPAACGCPPRRSPRRRCTTTRAHRHLAPAPPPPAPRRGPRPCGFGTAQPSDCRWTAKMPTGPPLRPPTPSGGTAGGVRLALEKRHERSRRGCREGASNRQQQDQPPRSSAAPPTGCRWGSARSLPAACGREARRSAQKTASAASDQVESAPRARARPARRCGRPRAWARLTRCQAAHAERHED